MFNLKFYESLLMLILFQLRVYEFSEGNKSHLGGVNRPNESLDDHETTGDQNDYNIPSNVDFICYQNVENRIRALLLVAKFFFGADKSYKYFIIDRGNWKTVDVSPSKFLWEGIPNQ